MGILQKKCRTTGKKALAYRGKGGQNTGTGFPALRLGVVLYLLSLGVRCFFFRSPSACIPEGHRVSRSGFAKRPASRITFSLKDVSYAVSILSM